MIMLSVNRLKFVRRLDEVLTSHSVKNPKRKQQILTHTIRCKNCTHNKFPARRKSVPCCLLLRNQAFYVMLSRDRLQAGVHRKRNKSKVTCKTLKKKGRAFRNIGYQLYKVLNR